MSETASVKPRLRQILLVDDDKDFTLFFKDFLLSYRPGAWIVHTADHYAPALAAIKEHPIDLVVLDLKMPIMDGLQLLPLLKRTHPELQIIVLTASAMSENRNFCLQNGAALFFDKSEVSDGLEKIYAALEAVASAPAEGFRGMLRQVGLSDVLQMECLGRKSSILEISGRESTGRIYIQDGSILHAEAGELFGEPALFHLLALKGGEFQLRPYLKPSRQTIDGHWESLMMEAARLSDEAAGGALEISTASAPAVTLPESESPRQIDEIVVCSSVNELLYEWQSVRSEKRIQLLDQLAEISNSLNRVLDWTRGDRLELDGRNGRSVLLFQPDRKVLIRSSETGRTA
ncbi:MAG TPA: response regulator [Verrucomicrobiae bacterium]|jgi:Response regulator containing CheY-like receiver domain and AraC-type DNA-binding domain